jgi:hypothetical protein
MSISNIRIAIGGYLEINTKDFVPEYAGKLPMDIGDFTVSIEAFSILLVKNVFMAIEQAEDEVPIRPPFEIGTDGRTRIHTIGEF